MTREEFDKTKWHLANDGLWALLAKFERDEGEGLKDGERLYRCIVCRQGWSIGGTFSQGPQHRCGCPVEELRSLLTRTVAGSLD